MLEFITVVIGGSILAIAASLFIARAARYSPLANIAIGSLTVITGFSLLVLAFIVLQRMASEWPRTYRKLSLPSACWLVR